MNIKKIIGYILLAVASFALLNSAYAKFFGGEMALQMYEVLNLAQYRVILGAIEILAVIMLWVPSCRNKGNLLATGYLGGAIMATFALGEQPYMAGIALVVLWLSIWMLNCSVSKEKCNCKEGCTCDKGVCNC